MSYTIGKAALNLQPTERVARTEYVDNWEVVRHYTEKDPCLDYFSAMQAFNTVMHMDFIWHTNDGPVTFGERGRVTDMGHAVYMENGSDYREMKPSPFTSVDEVLHFNAIEEYGLEDFDDLVQYYEHLYVDMQSHADQLVTGGYYGTLVSGALETFGWENLLQAAGEDPDTFGRDVLGSFFELSLHHYKAWAKTSIEFFMCHDDMVWTQGAFMHPDFYRKYIFPRYRDLWQVLKDAGKKVLFTTDGTFDMFLDDLMAAGADGFCFEPSNDLELLVRKCGQTHVLIGGSDCRTLTFGNKDAIEKEVRSVLSMTKDCPGFVYCVGNHFPANIPLENAIHYFELLEKLGKRSH